MTGPVGVGAKAEGESHGIALLSQELQLPINVDPSRLPRVLALPRVQQHRAGKDDP